MNVRTQYKVEYFYDSRNIGQNTYVYYEDIMIGQGLSTTPDVRLVLHNSYSLFNIFSDIITSCGTMLCSFLNLSYISSETYIRLNELLTNGIRYI